MKNGKTFRSNHYEFDLYYKEHYNYIEKNYLPVFKEIESETLFLSFTEITPYTKYLYQINYAELFPDEYLQYPAMLLNQPEYVIYLASQMVWLSDKK